MWRVAGSILTALVLLSSTARAEVAPRVRLGLDGCARLDAAAVTRIFAADLGAAVTRDQGPDVTEVTIACTGPRVVVRVVDPLSRKTLRRAFDSTSFGDRGESRLVAIAASELVLASWAELSSNPAPRVEPEGPRPSVESLSQARATMRARTTAVPGRAGPTPSPTSTSPSGTRVAEPGLAPRALPSTIPRPIWRVVGFASGRHFFQGRGELWGGGARFAADRPTVVSWALDLSVEQGKVEGVDATSESLGALLFAHRRVGPVTFRLGAGLRPGLLTIPGQVTLVTWGWPFGAASVSVRGGRLVIEVGAELGYGVLQIHGSSRPSLRAGWVAGNLGLGLEL